MKKTLIGLFIIAVLLSCACFVGCDKKTERSAYKINATLSGNELSAKMELDFFNHSDNALKQLKFNLYGKAFREDAKIKPIADQHKLQAYPNGQSYGDMQIKGVSAQGKALDYSICGQDQNILAVNLTQEVFPDERIQIQIDYVLTLANVIARTGYNEHTINLANFYPILCALEKNGFYECAYYSFGDPFYSDCADYSVTIKHNKKYKMACSGEVKESVQKGQMQVTKFSLNNTRSVAIVFSEKFSVKSEKVDGIKVNYYYYDDENPEKSIEFAKKSLRLFSNKFGRYPYSTYSIVQTKFIQGGMEFPSLVMISDELDGLAYGEVIVHETAHQWWQTTVGNNEVENGFLDEGLAEYSVVIFYEYYKEYGYTRKDLIKSSEDTFKVFCSVYDKLFGKVDTSMNRSLNEFSSEYEYVNISYIKPCIMYDTLRKTIGDERFFKALKRYYSQYSFKNATPSDMVGAFEKVGADSNGFFKSFFEGKEVI